MCVLSVFVSTCVLLCESCFVSGGVSTDCAVSSWLVRPSSNLECLSLLYGRSWLKSRASRPTCTPDEGRLVRIRLFFRAPPLAQSTVVLLPVTPCRSESFTLPSGWLATTADGSPHAHLLHRLSSHYLDRRADISWWFWKARLLNIVAAASFASASPPACRMSFLIIEGRSPIFAMSAAVTRVAPRCPWCRSGTARWLVATAGCRRGCTVAGGVADLEGVVCLGLRFLVVKNRTRF